MENNLKIKTLIHSDYLSPNLTVQIVCIVPQHLSIPLIQLLFTVTLKWQVQFNSVEQTENDYLKWKLIIGQSSIYIQYSRIQQDTVQPLSVESRRCRPLWFRVMRGDPAVDAGPLTEGSPYLLLPSFYYYYLAAESHVFFLSIWVFCYFISIHLDRNAYALVIVFYC